MHYPNSLGVGGHRVGTSSLTQTKPTTTPTTTTTLEMYAPTSPTTGSLPVESTVPEQTTPTTTPAAPESFALGSSSPSSSTSRRGRTRRRGRLARHCATQDKEKGDSGVSVSTGSSKSHPPKPPPRSSWSCPNAADRALDDTTSVSSSSASLATPVPDPPTTTSSDSPDSDDNNDDNDMGSGNLSGLSDQAIRKMAELLKMAPWLRHFQVSDDMMQQHGMIGPLRNEDLERQLLDELGVNRRNTKQEDDDDETESVLSESPYWKQDQLRHEYRQTKGALQHGIAECIQRRIQERQKEQEDEEEQDQQQEQDSTNNDDQETPVTVNKQKDKDDDDKDASTMFHAIVQCEPHIPKRVRPI